MTTDSTPTDSQPFTLLGIDHVVIRAADAGNLVDFYIRAIGCTLVWKRPELGLTHLSAGKSMIDIISLDGPLGQLGASRSASHGCNVDHICLLVDEIRFQALQAHFSSFGICLPGPEERFGNLGFGSSVYLQDPEGNGIELKSAASEQTRNRP